jgi:hypothetical protein
MTWFKTGVILDCENGKILDNKSLGMTGSKSGVMLNTGSGKILDNRSRLQDWSNAGSWKWENHM